MRRLVIPLVCACLCLCAGPGQFRASDNSRLCRRLLDQAKAFRSFKGMGQITVTQDKNQYEATLALSWNAAAAAGSAKIYSGLGNTIASLTLDSARARIRAGAREMAMPDTARVDSVAPEIPFPGSARELMQVISGALVASLPASACDSCLYSGALEQRDVLATIAPDKHGRITVDLQLLHASPVHIMYFYSQDCRIKKVSAPGRRRQEHGDRLRLGAL